MITQIVVLYIACLLNLPTWCKLLLCLGIGINFARFGYGLCLGANKDSETE